uniref:RdRp n=2 Tax=Ophiovirus ranunculi TaxID=2170049 RepID=A0AA96Y3U2_9VIRU|nr:RdRp [Ophiovirus ranunculi]
MEAYLREKNINYCDTPSTREVMSKFVNDFDVLTQTIKNEKEKEADEVKIDFEHKLVDLKNCSKDFFLNMNKIGTPCILVKLDSPYKEITQHNASIVLGSQFPKKWSEKNMLELFLFRETFLKEARDDCIPLINPELRQKGSIDLIRRLKKLSLASSESGVFLKFSGNLINHEISLLEKQLLGTKKRAKMSYEISEDAAKNYWVLDIFEHLNKNILRSASAKHNNRELDISIEHYEGKRLNTRYFPIGASISKVEFEKEGRYLIIFLSSTICAYYWDDGSQVYLGRPDMLQYSLYLADNLLSLSIVRNQMSESEKKFLDYYTSLLYEPEDIRIGMGGLYETTCLLLSDMKTLSASMPILDNVVESINVSLNHTEKLIEICQESEPEVCIRMSSIGKTLIIASTKPGKGISRYTQRTNRDNIVNENTVRRLRSLFKQRVISAYIKKHGRVPNLVNVPEDLGAQLEMKAAGGNYINQMISETSRYDEVRLGKFLEPGEEMNLQSRIIDKACSKDNYSQESNSEKEIHYYITHNMEDVFSEPMGIKKNAYRSSSRIAEVIHRSEGLQKNIEKYMLVKLSEKEREQKIAARFYGIASFKLKLWISSTMEMVKRAMKLLPGQMMTMTDDERREIMFKMSEKLLEEDTYSLFLDYSGHNTSQRPENTNFIMEEIANMYGYFEGSLEYEEFTSLPYVFSNIHLIVEDTWSDMIYYSKGQLGAIEGWLGGLWGIQSQLMLEDMFMQLGVKDFIGTTYSDDSCGVFTQKSMDVQKLNGIIKNVQRCGEDMGLIVKLSQTQVTNGRCSMLKEHYYKGIPIEMTLKKMMSISPNGPKILCDELESSTLIDSGFTSSCTRSSTIWTQALIRNFRIIKLLSSSLRKMTEEILQDNLDERYLSSKHNYEISMKSALRGLNKNVNNKVFIPAPRSRNIEFFQFHQNDQDVLDIILMFLYSPYTMYGFALTPLPDVLISGYSLSNVKRISYLQGILKVENVRKMGSLINLSQNAISYLDNPFPMIGGRKDTSLFVRPEIERILSRVVTNKELLDFLSLYTREDELEFKGQLVSAFKNCFSSRITGKFLESSLYAYVQEILSKIDNAATMKMLLGGRKMMMLIDKAWQANFRMKIKLNANTIINYDDLMFARGNKALVLPNKESVSLKFLEIEEIPIMGKVVHSNLKSMIQPIFKGTTKLTEEGRKARPPQRTFHNSAKFDRELGVDGMFEHKLIFKAYDLVRYVKWLMMEQEKFSSGMSEIDKTTLISICDTVLNTFTDAKYSDIEENVVCPKSGRYFHRALTGGFNPKTGDLSSNLLSGNYDITGVDQLIAKTGGVDNNLNLQYLMIYIRIGLAFLEPSAWELVPLTLTNDILEHIKDVSFVIKGLNEIKINKKLYKMASKKKIKERGKMYYNYSTFVEKNEDIADKFINHVSTTKEYFVNQESAFRSVHSYMVDQMIVSPELVSDDILKGLIGEEIFKEGRMTFFDKFYRYYKSLNVIGNETPSRSVIRGLLYEEMFSVNENSIGKQLWTDEMTRFGYSSGFKKALMRLFILSTSLSYRMVDQENNTVRLQVNKHRTIINSKSNFEKMRKGVCQFYIKDKRITEMIVNSFPTLGYTYSDIHSGASILCDEISNIEFEQMRLGSYYLKLHKSYTEKKENVHYGQVEFTEINVSEEDFRDTRGIDSALKGFETACSLMVSPEKVSSPTMSSVYPSAKGLLSLLKGNGFIKEDESVIELCGGRGDFHLAMMESNIKHTTISREDGYNLVMRIPGMTSKKVSFNCFKQQDYISYFDHNIILLDISHITSKHDCLSGIIGDARIAKKKMILRLNGLNKFLNEKVLDEMRGSELKVCLPALESPGYVYLLVDFTKQSDMINTSSISEKKGYNRSIISSSLINAVSKVDLKNVITVPPKQVQDPTMEIINDDKLIEMLVEEDPDYVHVSQEIKNKITSLNQFRDNMLVYVSNTYYERNREKLKELDRRIICNGNWREDRKLPENLTELGRKIREDDRDTIEVGNKVIRDQLVIIRGVTGMNNDELIKFMEEILNVKNNKKNSIECWKLILNLSGNEEIIDSDAIIDMINIKKFKKTMDRTINSSYEIASKAILSFKTGRIIEGLLVVANMGNLKRKAILDHKDKTTRTNILHYKLYMNRIMLASRSMYTEPYFLGIDNSKFEELWSNIGREEISLDLRGLSQSMNDEKMLEKFFQEINTEYFSFVGHFNGAISDLSRRLDESITNIPEITALDIGLGATEEEMEINRSIDTFEKLTEFMGESEIIGAWADIEEDFSD